MRNLRLDFSFGSYPTKEASAFKKVQLVENANRHSTV